VEEKLKAEGLKQKARQKERVEEKLKAEGLKQKSKKKHPCS
jgi:hypothetical protein